MHDELVLIDLYFSEKMLYDTFRVDSFFCN